MSQNKTVFSNFEYDHQFQVCEEGMSSSDSDFYRPSETLRNNATVISGLDNSQMKPSAVPMGEDVHAYSGIVGFHSRSVLLQERVIIGVLFSISKSLHGEIFPLYLGGNMIGSSMSCDIRLGEMSVSEEHAVIFARCEGYPGECHLSVTDYGSTHGTTVNQKDCRYETLPLKDGDILSIGKHYHMIVKLFDVSKSGLCEDSGFEAIQSVMDSDCAVAAPAHDFYVPSKGVATDNRTVIV